MLDTLLSQGGLKKSGGNCKVLTERKVEVALLSSGGPGESGGDCEASSGGDIAKVLLLRDGPGGDCEATLGGSRRSVLATDIISCLSSGLASGVASAPSGLHRASRHGASVRNSLAVRCWSWGPKLVLLLVLALKSFVIIV